MTTSSLGCYFGGGLGGSRGCHRNFPCLSLSNVYLLSLIIITVKAASLVIRVSRSTGLWASTWFQETGYEHGPGLLSNTDKALRGSLDHRHQHGVGWQCRQWISICPLVGTQAITSTQIPAIVGHQSQRDKAFGGSTDHRHQYGHRWLYRPLTSA